MRSRVTLSFGTMITAPSLRSSKGIAWRSRSLMMPAESSTLRAVKRVVICGVVTRMMTKAKKLISAAVTATHPDLLGNRQDPAKPTAPQDSARKRRLGNYCLWDGFDMVNGG